MVTEINHKMMPGGVRYSEFRGLSTDTKPEDGVCNGSVFYEMDTGFTSYFDATPSTGGWTEAPAGGTE